MTETQMLHHLTELLEEHEGEPEARSIETFREAGVLTGNKGLIVAMADGSTFHITVVKE